MSEIVARGDRPFDVVLYGATSFVGRLVAEHLQRRAAKDGAIRWAIAGRDPRKLEQLRAALALDVPVLLAEATDDAALDALASQARVIASTVGPYGRYGSSLVRACATAGTDYCDLTAEVPWMCAMIEQHGDIARRTGARLVHGCGFDSIPSDLGVWHLQQTAQQQLGEYCVRVEAGLKKASGGFSGGTAASLADMVACSTDDRQARALMLNPYALAGGVGGVQKDRLLPARNRHSGEWSAPFIMAPINTRVVQRSHALSGFPWGADFCYEEVMYTGKGVIGAVMAAGVTVALGGLVTLAAVPLTRPLLKKMLPDPGTGPSRQSIESGFFELHGNGITAGGQRVRLIVRGDKDPGYGATSRMLGETALCLAEDDGGASGGFLTPSTALGETLLARLEKYAGMQFHAFID